MRYVSKNFDETYLIAKDIAGKIKPGDILLLSGDLGAGKTAFTRCLCDVFGVKEVVSSPSFTIIKEYNAENFKIYHIDLYRLSSEDELVEIGFEEIINNHDSIKIIEWPDCGKDYYNGFNVINIKIEIDEDGTRFFEVE